MFDVDGMPRPSGRKPSFPHAEAVARVIAGEKQSDVAASYGVTECSISYVVRKADLAAGYRLPRPSRGPRRRVSAAKLAEMLAAGMTHAEIARRLGVDHSTVWRAASRESAKPSSPTETVGFSGWAEAAAA